MKLWDYEQNDIGALCNKFKIENKLNSVRQTFIAFILNFVDSSKHFLNVLTTLQRDFRSIQVFINIIIGYKI